MTNFNIGYQNNKSDVLLHLTQWQYWWWFWFSFVWALYYLIIMRTIRRRRLKFHPKLATTMRPHGKWGDLLACIIPLSWCINILINSSFLLKLIEWQNESSLFTVKIRGRQWYWIYRIDFKNFTRIITAPKNIGHNKWVLFTHNNTKQCDDYMSALQFRRQSNWMVKFWSEVARDEELFNLDQPMNLSFYQSVVKSISNSKSSQLLNSDSVYLSNNQKVLGSTSGYINDNNLFGKSLNLSNYNNVMFLNLYTKDYINSAAADEAEELLGYLKSWTNPRRIADNSPEPPVDNTHWIKLNKNPVRLSNSTANSDRNVLFSSNVEETVRFYRKKSSTHDPITIRPSYISDSSVSYIKDGTSRLLYLNMPTGKGELEAKPKLYENFLVRKQKRYKVRKEINPKTMTLSRSTIKQLNNTILTGNEKIPEVFKEVKAKLLITKNRSLDMPNDKSSLARKYKMFKVNKKKSDANNLNVNRRMLRTSRTLILPAHVNITAVTNSFDVIHSWFIPGLGLKMDCIPGRATHHTFYIDNVGFYYGQCAEVCGRYHHHMPIRICALPFEHFLLWWHHFGARRFLNPVVNRPGMAVDNVKSETAWRTQAKIDYKDQTGEDISRDPRSLKKRHLNAYGLRKYTW